MYNRRQKTPYPLALDVADGSNALAEFRLTIVSRVPTKWRSITAHYIRRA
jgi:hypothetical protein